MARLWFDEKERGTPSLMRLMRMLALRLGRRRTTWLLPPITAYYFVQAMIGRRGLRHYYQTLGRPSGLAVLFRHYLRFAHTILDRIYLFSSHADAPKLEIRGWESIKAELARGQGCVLLGAHIGNFEAVRATGIGQPGLKMQVIIAESLSQKLNRALACLNPDVDATAIPLGGFDALLRLRDTVAEGGLVRLMGDRVWRNEAAYRTQFLGRETYFPKAPLRLAAALRAPVFFFSALYRTSADGSPFYDVVFERLTMSAPEGLARCQWMDDLGDRYVAVLQRHCLSAPDNWFNFYDFWAYPPADGASRSTALDPHDNGQAPDNADTTLST
ncbi:MAG: LpxL/LpxP family acyltransferase [Acidiferrobacter sp.]